MKTKRIALCALFCAIVIALFFILNSFALNKLDNRYYALEYKLEEENKNYDLQIYGSCHAYTSFNAKYFENEYGVSSYVLANPSELIPITYLRIMERFKTDLPEVLLLETWGMNTYDTYFWSSTLLEIYSPINLELIPSSPKRTEVINDFPEFNAWELNVPLIRYKEYFLNRNIHKLDFEYSYDLFLETATDFIKREMDVRAKNNGFRGYDDTIDVSEDFKNQPIFDNTDVLPYEEDMVKYLEKIIDLCEENNVKLILYRAPYTVTENEAKKTSWLENYCTERNIPYYNTEKEIEFDYVSDFTDQYHLNEYGAKKVTDFLSSIILENIKH